MILLSVDSLELSFLNNPLWTNQRIQTTIDTLPSRAKVYEIKAHFQTDSTLTLLMTILCFYFKRLVKENTSSQTGDSSWPPVGHIIKNVRAVLEWGSAAAGVFCVCVYCSVQFAFVGPSPLCTKLWLQSKHLVITPQINTAPHYSSRLPCLWLFWNCNFNSSNIL